MGEGREEEKVETKEGWIARSFATQSAPTRPIAPNARPIQPKPTVFSPALLFLTSGSFKSRLVTDSCNPQTRKGQPVKVSIGGRVARWGER